LKPDIRKQMIKRLEEMVKGAANSFGITATLNVSEGYPVLVNDPKLVKHVTNCAGKVLGAENVHSGLPRMGAEDFAYFCQKWGGVMVGLGCHDPDKGFQHSLHSPYFNLDEKVLEVGTLLFGHVLTKYLERP
jgi:metal-dependent amidase/aminoacylase/carboxypeptidase family protein